MADTQRHFVGKYGLDSKPFARLDLVFKSRLAGGRGDTMAGKSATTEAGNEIDVQVLLDAEEEKTPKN